MTDSTGAGMRVNTTVTVPLDLERAFGFFVDAMTAWWPPEVHLLPSATCAVTVEPKRGGRWYERSPQGDEADWGKVLEYERPHRLVLSWQLLPDPAYDSSVDDHPEVTYDPGCLTELEVTFTPDQDGRARVALEHRMLENLGSGAGADEIRDLLAGDAIGWPEILGRYARSAEGAV